LQRSVRYTPAALRDIDAAFRWLSQPGSGARAQRRMRRIRAAVDGLADHPCRYPFGPHAGRREFTCETHRIVYRVRAAVARLESRRLRSTTRALERYAKATHTRLRMGFVPDKAAYRRRRHRAVI